MAETPRLIQRQGSGKMNDKILVAEHLLMNGLINPKSDGYIVDLESFSNGDGLCGHISAYSRITLPRSLSRKGHHRAAGDSNSLLVAAAAATCSSPSSSPKGAGQTGPSSMQERPAAAIDCVPLAPVVITVGPTPDEKSHDPNPQPNEHPHHHHHHQHQHQHQITVKTGSIIPTAVVSTTTTTPESQLAGRRRSQLPWYSHPKRVLLFFATISSIGTLLLICFTLAINKPYSSSD